MKQSHITSIYELPEAVFGSGPKISIAHFSRGSETNEDPREDLTGFVGLRDAH
jgi:hypothetical protein